MRINRTQNLTSTTAPNSLKAFVGAIESAIHEVWSIGEQNKVSLTEDIDTVSSGYFKVSQVAPDVPEANQMYIDRSVDPPELKVYNAATESYDSVALT